MEVLDMNKAVIVWWQDKEHPLWACVKLMTQTGGLSLLLFVFATNFDASEVKTLIGAGLLNVFIEGFKAVRKV